MVLVVVILVGCESSATGSSSVVPALPTATPVPWIADLALATPFPTAAPTPRPSGLRSCASSDLVGVFEGGQGAGGWITRVFRIGNRTASSCILDGPIRAAYLDAAGKEIVATSVDAASINSRWVVVSAWTEPVASSPRLTGQALIGLATYGDCGPAPFLAAVALTFSEPTDRVVIPMAPTRIGGRCDAPEESLGLGIFFPLSPAPTEMPQQTPAPQRLSFSIEAPHTAPAGAPLTYAVRIRNVSAEPYTWSDGCPLYLEWLVGHEVDPTNRPNAVSKQEPSRPTYVGGVKETHPLNCLAAGAIAPGADVTFEMRISVPPDARGPDSLRWQIVGPDSSSGASAAIVLN